MLVHRLGENLVPPLQLPFQGCDTMLLLALVRRGLASESSSAVLEELLLPTVEDRRLEA